MKSSNRGGHVVGRDRTIGGRGRFVLAHANIIKYQLSRIYHLSGVLKQVWRYYEVQVKTKMDGADDHDHDDDVERLCLLGPTLGFVEGSTWVRVREWSPPSRSVLVVHG
ncbi:hypothetical protein L484_016669 [Morus notabilis]|uniref:Uncharacterized protein n=1 Tax=Morus notabilis TaxID=981085 RepID=W9RRJ5_9ROSA|nr:hypothetical protein L484_016669 [Morus notabilis]